MNTLIIEDELIAAQNLQRLLAQADPTIKVVNVLQSVEETIDYFATPNDIELVFMDIHLADGLAFHIFDKVNIPCPIIFTTAYDQYALDAFKVNSIDYLLKPISLSDLQRAIEKLKTLKPQSQLALQNEQINALMAQFQHQNYKSYFLIPVRDRLIPINVDDIAFFYIDDKLTRAVTYDGHSHIMEKPLDAIYSQLNPAKFFRANRQYIIAHAAIRDISVWPLSKLHLSLSIPTPDKIIIPRARAAEFKEWYTN
jgi:two-component system LytT family response regulator